MSRVHELARLGRDDLVKLWFTTGGSRASRPMQQAAARLWTKEQLIAAIVEMEEGGAK